MDPAHQSRSGDGTGTALAEPAPLLRATGIVKTYGPVRALRGVDLCLEPGEIVALAGENGSGKSTLSKVIAGVVQPDAGELVLDGRPVSFHHPRAALEHGIAIVSQDPTALPLLSVADNVLLPRVRSYTSLSHRAARTEAAREPLLRVGLDIDPDMPLGALPGGDRELVEVAKALALRPKLLILDEVTARLPEPERLFAVVRDLVTRDGLAVVFISHRLREIHQLCDRAVVLRDGEKVGELARQELTDTRIASLMVGRDLGSFFHKADVRPAAPVLTIEQVVTERSPHPIDLTVRRGEIVGLAGLVGAGRSELLETVAGVRRPLAGTVRVDGTGIRPHDPRAARAAGIGFVPEERFVQALVPGASIAMNLAMPGWRMLARSTRNQDRARGRAAIRDFGIRAPGQHTPVGRLSGGNAQKVVVARALATEPDVLLLDEPTRGVDVGARSEIYELIARMVESGAGVLMASSDMLELLGLADRIVVLHDGEVVGELSRAEATEQQIALLSHGGGGA